MTSHLVALFFNKLGVVAVVIPDKPGLEYDTLDSRAHYHVQNKQLHYDTLDSRDHYHTKET